MTRPARFHAALAATLTTLALSACAAPEAPVEPAPTLAPQTASGERCIGLAAIRNTRVVDDSTIDFIMRDGRILRNTLPHACPSLGFEEAFTHSPKSWTFSVTLYLALRSSWKWLAT